jgi:hypothetical protein
MDEKHLVLRGSIRSDLAAIQEIFRLLDTHPVDEHLDYDRLIVAAYHLHNLYNAFENIFLNIASAFKTQL